MPIRLIVFVAALLSIGVGVTTFILLFDSPKSKLSPCHSESQIPYSEYLSTKTPYISDNASTLNFSTPEKCDPVQIWILGRHGTRNPSKKDIKKMKTDLPTIQEQIVKAHQGGRGTLCPQELDAISKWKPLMTLHEDDDMKLVSQGKSELRGIGKRFRDRFPTLFQNKYRNETYKSRFTNSERTESSAKSFAEGVFGPEEAGSVWYPNASSVDPLLHFYKYCHKWSTEVDKNPEAKSEQTKFLNSTLVETLRKRIQNRCGFENPMSFDTIESIYITCQFETAWDPSAVSPWCLLFDKGDLEVILYYRDLESYWIDGYGHEINYKQACVVMNDLVEHFGDKIKDGDKEPSGIASFSHSGALVKLISLFGLFNDSIPLRHNNTEIHKERKWKTSQIDRFGTNLAAVLYNCSGDFRIELLFQEQTIRIPGCTEDLCPWEMFLSKFDPIVNGCDISEMCRV